MLSKTTAAQASSYAGHRKPFTILVAPGLLIIWDVPWFGVTVEYDHSGVGRERPAGEFVNLTPATLDLRLVSIASQLRDKGAASGGTTTDIFGTAIYNGTRDIGAYEFTESSGTPAGGGLPYYVLRRRRGFAHTLRISG